MDLDLAWPAPLLVGQQSPDCPDTKYFMPETEYPYLVPALERVVVGNTLSAHLMWTRFVVLSERIM